MSVGVVLVGAYRVLFNLQWLHYNIHFLIHSGMYAIC